MDGSGIEPVIAGRYLVRHALGAGGMADVVAADDLETGERVAVKVLHQPLDDALIDRRLLQELLSASQVAHPNLVAILDFGVAAATRRPFFVMELLTGADLASYLNEYRSCAADWFVPLFCDALDGLDAVHRRGIVHKDIKPANLFLDRKEQGPPRLRITDFGIAHHMQRSRITQEGGMACTPRYTPPEYFDSGVVTPASDVYQMGLVLAECLLGWPMVEDGPFATVAFAHARGNLRLPPGFAMSPVGQVVCRALALRSRDRFDTASAFAAALREIDLQAAGASIELHAAMYLRRIEAG
ncbi:MAG TPA: serine/threonine-protein kinase [Ramlibacter sp.]|nr:serine/threonine-protein kinase [Ramlibacter sp.]